MTSYPGRPAAPKKTLIWLAIASFALGLVLTAFSGRIVETVGPNHSDLASVIQPDSEDPPGSGVDPRFPVRPGDPPSDK